MSSQLAMPHPVYGRYPPTHVRETSVSNLQLASDSDPSLKGYPVDDIENIPRTPSPTTEEYNLLHGIRKERTLKEKIIFYGIIAVLVTLGILLSIYSKNIVNALNPETQWLRDHPAGPLIPIALFIIVSFPPLFGHEIIGLLVGVTWDLWPAFAITSIGTLLGEIANFFVFKYACSARSNKYQEKDLDYGLMAYVVRRGGFLMIVAIRFSAIPPHYATAIFSTVGISFFVFLSGAVVSLPRQFVVVYTGYAMKPSVSDDTTSKIIENVLIAATVIATIGTGMWISRQLKAAREGFIYERRKARQAKMLQDLQSGKGPQQISLPVV